ncbi:MAG: Ger(x)C family spore germination C-terminal domain-containing protein [Clostridia bacterium]
MELNLIANIISLNSNINYEDTDTINKISTATQNRLNDELNKYFDKTARKYNVDIDKYYLSILKYFPYQKKL